MDVDTTNFQEVLLQLRTLVPECDFVSIDMEFTGLDYGESSGPECFSPQSKPLDSCGGSAGNLASLDAELQARYEKLRASTGFLVVQVGICPFSWDDEGATFVAHPYNFYTFPQEFRGQDRRFLCQTRCMSFLAESKFDFNKLFRTGIPFINVDQEATARATAPVTSQEAVITKMREQVVAFLADTTQASTTLPAMSPFHRKLTYEDLTSTFRNAVTTDRASVNGEVCIKVNRTDRWHEMGRDATSIWRSVAERARETAERDVFKAIGFRHVVDILAECGKPLVGHNMLLDLVQLHAHFLGEPPEKLEDFQKAMHAKFNTIIDTKYLIHSSQALASHFTSGSRLDWVHKACSAKPFTLPAVRLARGHDRYGSGQHLHEAGYDAYITGHCLLRLGHHVLMVAQEAPPQTPLPKNTTGLTPRLRDGAHLRPYANLFKKLKRYTNRLLITGCRTSFIDINSEDEEEGEVADDRKGQHNVWDEKVHTPQEKERAWQIASGSGHRGPRHMVPQNLNLPKQRAREQQEGGGSVSSSLGKKEKRPRMSA